MPSPGFAETNVFLAVLEQKSFSKAAKLLGLSPARVSELVRQMEDSLGVRLIERTTRSVAPTAAGERLLARLRPALDEYQAALESTNEFRGKPAGTLRLTAPQPAADFFLASAIPRFLAQYPEISLDLSVSDTLTDIVAERFDAGIRIGERIERDMIAVRVTDEMPLVVAGSPAYFEQRGKPKTPDDLVGHDRGLLCQAVARTRSPAATRIWNDRKAMICDSVTMSVVDQPASSSACSLAGAASRGWKTRRCA